MKRSSVASKTPVWVAIDVAKVQHEVLIERRDGRRIRMTVANALSAFENFATFLATLSIHCEVALEPTGDYHRPLANFLLRRGNHVHFVSSIACHQTREALFNFWDKNDPKDAQVILHLLKGGVMQRFSDPLEEGNHDFQELLGTYRRIADRKMRVYHTLMTHYLPLYFPETEPFIASSRSEWFLDVFLFAPIPADVLALTKSGVPQRDGKERCRASNSTEEARR